MDGDDGVGAIVLAAEHLLAFRRLRPPAGARRARARDRRRRPRPRRPIRCSTPMSSARRVSDSRSVRSSSSRRRRCMTFCASAWLLQKSGAAMLRLDFGELFVEAGTLKDASAARATRLFRSSYRRSDLQSRQPTRSSMGHLKVGLRYTTACSGQPAPTADRAGNRHVGDDVADPRVDGPARQEAHLLDEPVLLKDTRLRARRVRRGRRRR